MNATPRTSVPATLAIAMRGAVQWRLWLTWLGLTLLPTVPAALAVWSQLDRPLSYSPQVAAIASGKAPGLLLDLMNDESLNWGAVSMALLVSFALMLLLSPLITAMIAGAWRQPGARFRTLLREGADGYAPMLRMLLWSMIPLGLAAAVGGSPMGAFLGKAATAITPAEMAPAKWIFWGLLVPLLVVAHAGVEAGRGQLAAHPEMRGAIRAWSAGMRLLFKRPVAVLLVELVTLLAVLVPLIALVWLRQRFDAGTTGGWWAALLVTWAGIVVIGWGRIARLFGMARLAGEAIR